MKTSKLSLATLALALPLVTLSARAHASELTPLCDDPRQLCSIEPAKYLGSWYEIGRTAIISDTFEANLDCVKASYALESATTISVTNSGYDTKTHAASSIVGSATIDNASELTVSFGANDFGGEISDFFQGLLGPNYKIQNVWVDANGDYQRALVVDSFLGVEFIWILSRTPSISSEDVAETLDYVRSAGYFPDVEGWSLTTCTDAERAALPPADQ